MEPIAIVGLACRFPSAAHPAALWDLLARGGDALADIADDRWNVGPSHDPDPAAPGKSITRRAGLLDQVDQFDPLFFGISPREAEHIDPQQRLMLELSWEALEDAAVVPTSLADTSTGVFFG